MLTGLGSTYKSNKAMQSITEMIAIIATVFVWIRMWPFIFRRTTGRWNKPVINESVPLVSIIVPARDEALMIRGLLASLLQLNESAIEIIVVDDASKDDTARIAAEFPVKVISAPEKPANWVGKNWACFIGAREAKGKLLLFTDADTRHKAGSLIKAIRYLNNAEAQLLSVPIYHSCRHWWEKLIGPFHCLMQFANSPYRKHNASNAIAVGQYLLFDAAFYHSIGGHAAVYNQLCEDAELAKRVLKFNGKFVVHTDSVLCESQMYTGFEAFANGWTRLLRLGLQQLSITQVLLTLLPLFALNVYNWADPSLVSLLPVMLTLSCFGLVQQRIGRFNIAGLLLFPFSVLMFLVLSCRAMWYGINKAPVEWRGRVYQNAA
ncbi:MAG: glycosyltransferase [Chitinophagaceae bacterium]|nr:glycosyltransferase [Chitinophagaceae bacterium]